MAKKTPPDKFDLATNVDHARAGGAGAALAALRAAALAQRVDPALAAEMRALAARLGRVDPSPHLALARLHAEAGDLDAAIREAQTVLAQAIDKAARARAAFMLGEIARARGEPDSARTHFQTVMKIEDELLATTRNDPSAVRWYARARGRVAELDRAEGALERARAGAEGALAMLRAGAAHVGEGPMLAADIADAEMRLAAYELDDHQPASARRRLDEAIGRYEALAVSEKDEPHWRAVLADAWTLAAEAEFQRNAHDRAREAMDLALNARLRLAAHYPAEAWGLAGVWRIRAALRAALGDEAAASDSLTQARRIAETLLQRAPKSDAARRFLVHTMLDQADQGLRSRALAEARDAADAARQIAEAAAQSSEPSASWYSEVAAAWDRLGEVAHAAGDAARRQEALARAVEFRRMAHTHASHAGPTARALAAELLRLGEAALDAGAAQAAMSAFAESTALRRSLHQSAPSADAANALAVALERCGLAANALGERAAAFDAWVEELGLADAIFGDDDNPEGMRFRAIVEAHLAGLGGPEAESFRSAALRKLDILSRAGALNEAEAALRKRLWSGA